MIKLVGTEDMDYNCPTKMIANRGFDLAGEMVAALASESIVFRDDAAYSKKLVQGASVPLKYGDLSYMRELMCTEYCGGDLFRDPYGYNSTGYHDE
ncbi:endoglucanase 12, partial [Tanacetum coccineum]